MKKKESNGPSSWHGFVQVEKEIKLACQRVGTSSVARSRWLLDFAYEDLANLSQGQLSDRGWEVAALVIPPDFETRTDYRTSVDLAILTQPIPGSSTRKVPEGLVRNFHDLMKQGLNDLFKGPGWEITEPARTRTVSLIDPPHYGTRIQVDTPRPLDRLTVVAFDLIEAERIRLGRCRNPKCERPFVAVRKGRAFFCSPRCSAYVRVNKARGKLADIYQAKIRDSRNLESPPPLPPNQ